jgi:hypothetical protein
MNKTVFLNITSDKGLRKILFEDDYKQKCSLIKSNAALEDKIWFGVDKDADGKTVVARMHLTQEHVRNLLPYLQKFVDTGDLFE